jgi:hypothetical protein
MGDDLPSLTKHKQSRIVMAIKVAPTVQKTGWNNRIFFPKDQYTLRILEEDNTPSKQGNPMVKLEFEIVNCPIKQIGDLQVDMNGTRFSSWFVTKIVKSDKAKTPEDIQKFSDKAFNDYDTILKKLGVDVSEGWDDENPPSVKGKVFYAIVYGKAEPSYKSPTPEQIAKGQKVGDKIKDPVTGQEVIVYRPELDKGQIFGLCTEEVAPF